MRRSHALVLEPMHTLRVSLDERASGELMSLRESKLSSVRTRLTAKLDALDAAGQALRWMRDLAPIRVAEPLVWDETIALLDKLDAPTDATPARSRLAAAGLRLLIGLGYGLELSACVRCARPCPPQSPAYLDPVIGGLVCTGCGGAATLIRPQSRQRALRAIEGEDEALDRDASESVLSWVEQVLQAHGGLKQQASSA